MASLQEKGAVVPCKALSKDDISVLKWEAGIPTEKCVAGPLASRLKHEEEGLVNSRIGEVTEPTRIVGNLMIIPDGRGASLQVIQLDVDPPHTEQTKLIFSPNGRDSILFTSGVALATKGRVRVFNPDGDGTYVTLRVKRLKRGGSCFRLNREPLNRVPKKVKVLFNGHSEGVGRK